MDYGEYCALYDGLRTPEDIDRYLAKGYDRRLLETLYTQKISRDVKKRYHVVKSHSEELLRDWQHGKTIVQIADSCRFPPILTAMLLFQEDGTGKKVFWEYVRDPSLLDCPEAAQELREATARDLVYSPAANDSQKERGQWGEGLLWQWLDAQDISYKTEADERGDDDYGGGKTPDCLFAHPMSYEGHKICWIESKASFGDKIEFRLNQQKQLIPYTELFGQGIVVYWTGHLDGLACPAGVYLEDIGILQKKLTDWQEPDAGSET